MKLGVPVRNVYFMVYLKLVGSVRLEIKYFNGGFLGKAFNEQSMLEVIA